MFNTKKEKTWQNFTEKYVKNIYQLPAAVIVREKLKEKTRNFGQMSKKFGQAVHDLAV